MVKQKKAFITGVTGQDGSYLAELLLDKGYEVHGLKRRSSSLNSSRIDHLMDPDNPSGDRFKLHFGDITDSSNIRDLLADIQPDEIYNLAAQSHVAVSFETPEYTTDTIALGTLRLLHGLEANNLLRQTKFYQASTSELYGGDYNQAQNEETPFKPRSPYAIAKLYAYWITRHYREDYGLFACNGILFNHESPRRGETFVTRKITRGLAQIVTGLQKSLLLGNLSAKRDWGHAKDYVYMQWLMLQVDKPDDYVIATGQQCSVRDFVLMAASAIGLEIEFRGSGIDEVGIVSSVPSKFQDFVNVGDVIVKVDERHFRPAEVNSLLGDPNKALQNLGWQPEYDLKSLCKEMVEHDLSLAMQKKGLA